MERDQQIITQIRAKLRTLKDLAAYKRLKRQQKEIPWKYRVWEHFFELLLPLRDWKPKKSDPFFSSIRLYNHLKVLDNELTIYVEALLNEDIRVGKQVKKILEHIQKKVRDIGKTHAQEINDLQQVYGYIQEIKAIFDITEESTQAGLKRLECYRWDIDTRMNAISCESLEHGFLDAFFKYMDTKAEFLFNYREFPGNYATSNFIEQRFHLLKHLLRRIIGQASAKEYLATHGARLLQVDQHASLDLIQSYFMKMDQTEARRIINSERRTRNEAVAFLHQEYGWPARRELFAWILENYKEQTRKYGEIREIPEIPEKCVRS